MSETRKNRLDRLRLDRGVQHLHALGARVTAEFVAELARRTGDHSVIRELLAEYAALTPAQVRAAGADCFAPQLRAIPVDLRRGRP